jgi:Tfp pilus assembly protein PilX
MPLILAIKNTSRADFPLPGITNPALQLRSDQRGIALVTTMIILVMMLLFGGVLITATSFGLKGSTRYRTSTEARYAAESGAEMAFDQIWNNYLASTVGGKAVGSQGTMSAFANFLASLPNYVLGSSALANGATVNLTSLNKVSVGDGLISSVSVTRTDIDSTRTRLVFTSNGQYSASNETVQEVFDFVGAAGTFSGFGYAMLANNINCIVCHLKVDNMNGTQRVRVGSLESLMIRSGSCDSLLAGTLYTRGRFLNKDGSSITNYISANLDSQHFDSNGNVQLQGNGQPLLSNLQPAPTTPDGYPYRMANFYQNYPSDPAYQSDGPLPSKFPPPVADKNGNRRIDADEFLDKMNQSTGSLSGGVKKGVPNGNTFSGNTLDNMTSNLTSVAGSYNGNLVLNGTDANPIVINGDIAVNGDLVIKGKVKGTGRIYVRGNSYVIGDIEYADGTVNGIRTFGKAQDGTQNLLAIASCGNITVGDFVTKADGKSVDTGTSGQTNMNFVSSDLGIFNRNEWGKTQQYLPDKSGNLIANSSYIPGYIPRYYTLYSGDPVGFYMDIPIVDKAGKIIGYDSVSPKVYWDPTIQSWVGSEHTTNYGDFAILPQTSPLLSGAVVMSLAPASNWISISQLQALWAEDGFDRPAGDILNIDGLLYSNNGTFELARKKSDTVGRITIQGALVSADVGVLAAGGNNVLNGGTPGPYIRYDARLANFLTVANDTPGVTVIRMTWKN